MPALLRGNTQTYERQPTGTLKLYPDGSCEATETFRGTYAKRLENLPVALQPHPDFPTLKLFEFLGSKEPGEIYQYACVYKGILPDTDVWALMQEDVTLMSAQEPVETFWRFSYPWNDPPVTTTLLSQVQAAIDANVADITAVYPNIDPEGDASGKAAYNLWLLRRRGIDSVKVPQLSVRLSYVADASLGSWYLTVRRLISLYVGTIALDSDGTYLAINRARSVPTPGNFEFGSDEDRKRNYLLNGVSWRLQGNLLNVSEDYLLSGRSGWVPYLYERESGA